VLSILQYFPFSQGNKYDTDNSFKRREECNTYLTHVCRHHWSRESQLSSNIVAFISYRLRLTKVLTGVAMGKWKVRVGKPDWGYWMIVGIEVQVDMPFQIGVGLGRGGIWEFVNDMNGPWDWVLMGTSGSEFTTMQVDRCLFTHFKNILPVSPM
jgi:hypothetical protein